MLAEGGMLVAYGLCFLSFPLHLRPRLMNVVRHGWVNKCFLIKGVFFANDIHH